MQKLKPSSTKALYELLEELRTLDNAEIIIDKTTNGLKEIFGLEECKLTEDIKTTKDTNNLSLPITINNKVIFYINLECKTPLDYETIEIFTKELSYIIARVHSINELKLSNEKLLQQDLIKTQLISTISHELRTPLANVLGFSELLLNKEYPEAIRKQYVQEIYEASLRLSNLINNFLDLSRLEHGGDLMLHDFEQTELDWLAERAWSQLKSINGKHQIQWHFAANLPEPFIDAEAITRVFINLFSNAIKYSPAKGNEKKIINCSIEYKANESELLVSIQDHGIGMATEVLNLIFEKFYRISNPDTRHISGTGLGLWITKKIIEAHGGKIWCESKAQEGSCFYFTLPCRS